jgi:tetratricopeptide (TPR) repeat protein
MEYRVAANAVTLATAIPVNRHIASRRSPDIYFRVPVLPPFLQGFCLRFVISIRAAGLCISISAIVLLLSLMCTGQASSLDRNQKIRNLIANNQLAAAEKLIVSGLVDEPHDAELITYLAELRVNQGRTDEALRLVDDAEHIDGTTALRAQIAGLANSARGQLAPAEKRFRQAIQLDPKFVAAHYFLARLLYTRNRFDEAIQESKATIALSPDFVRAYENLGLCYEGKDDSQQAEYWYREAIRHNSEAPTKTEWPLLDLATLMIRNEKIAEARPFLQQALALNPQNAQSYLQMGILLEKSGDLQNALEQLHTAIKLDPKLASAYYRAARLCQKLGREQESQRDFEKYGELTQPKN